MSEQQLQDFGAHAESLVEIPDFDQLDRRGRDLRVRRRVAVATALAVVLTVAGVALSHHRSNLDSGPVHPNPPVKARPYPGSTMKNLKARTYDLHPSRIQSDLVAELTVPEGWNAWVGPNRYDGHRPGRSNSEALDYRTWYVGALVIEVNEVNTGGCAGPDDLLDTPQEIVTAMSRAFSTEVLRKPTAVQAFGHQGTRMRLRVTPEVNECPGGADGVNIFYTTANGYIGYADVGTILDIWLLDVDGATIYVQRAWTPNAPDSARSELDDVIASIRFKTGE